MKSRWVLVVASVAFAAGLGVSPVEAQSHIYWVESSSGAIARANLDGSGVEVLVDPGLPGPWGIAVDVAGGKMYWTDWLAGKIQRANLQIPPGETPENRTDIEDLVTDLTSPRGIALDPAGGKMYWTDAHTEKIQRANLDGSDIEDLVTTGLSDPWGIALDVARWKMYWTDTGTRKVQRGNLDGGSIEDLYTTPPPGELSPVAIAVDANGGKMYWTLTDMYMQVIPGKMQRANLDGSGVEVLVEPGAFGSGLGLDPPRGKVYWTYIITGLILRANLDGSGAGTLFDTGGGDLNGIALDLPVSEIPTVSQWGVITMIALLLAVGAIIIRGAGVSRGTGARIPEVL